jgi:pyruvate formate lyase activating enzyme
MTRSSLESGCTVESTGAQNGLTGIVFNIQGYSIHDGPGIRTTVFIKGCPLSCFWCQNPESQLKKPQVLLNKDKCVACGRCVKECPEGAISITETCSTIDRSKCIACGACCTVCPVNARNLTGKLLTVDEVMVEVLRDKKFYEKSGGGVTLSGGEPTAQAEFSLNILRRCKEEGLHTALETCGYASWQTMQKLLPYLDLVLYDIKCMDAEKHRQATGMSNDVILNNAKRISECKPMMVVRVPLIPGFNDSPEEIRKIAEFVKTELGPIEVHLLPYNKLGEGKSNRLDKEGVHLEMQNKDYIAELEAVVKSEFAEAS